MFQRLENPHFNTFHLLSKSFVVFHFLSKAFKNYQSESVERATMGAFLTYFREIL